MFVLSIIDPKLFVYFRKYVYLTPVFIISALPAESPVLRKLDSGLRYQYATDSKGEAHLVDLWLTAADIYETARYNAVSDNVYHLFTRWIDNYFNGTSIWFTAHDKSISCFFFSTMFFSLGFGS